MKRIAAGLVIVISVFAVTVAAAAAADSPGSEGDPVVTKSYVDSQIAKLKGGGGTVSDSYVVVQVGAGQKLLGHGGTEIILRSGEATAIDNGANGVSDLTSGTDLMTGQNVGLNHLLLVPKDDGRGIFAKTELFVMVRGSYSIQ